MTEQQLDLDAIGAAVDAHVAKGGTVIMALLAEGVSADELLAEARRLKQRVADLRAVIAGWLKDHAYAPDDIVLGHHGLAPDECASLYLLLDALWPDWRSVYAPEQAP